MKKNWLFAFFLWLFSVMVLAQEAKFPEIEGCGKIDPTTVYGYRYGPFDYTNSDHVKSKLFIVEINHFNDDIELLRRGISGMLSSDLGYTLMSFPNHHRALQSLTNYWFREKFKNPDLPENKPIPGMQFTIECWFYRAISWRPKDPRAWLLYGNFDLRRGKIDMAIARYEKSMSLGNPDGNLYYAMGLAYLAKGDLKKASEAGTKAYQLGASLPALKQKLIKAGVWVEPKPLEQESPKPELAQPDPPK